MLTTLLSQPESRRDDEPKKKTGLKKEIWSRHHSYFGKLWKTIKIRQVCKKKKKKFWIRESITRKEGVSTLQRPHKDGTFN